MTVIATSTAATATAYANQRKIDRCSNGVLWACFWAQPVAAADKTSRAFEFWYSTDGGVTFNEGTHFGCVGTNDSYIPNVSFFIDLDDYAHVVYKDRHSGSIYYRRGTPNAARTAWTWSAATVVYSGAGRLDYPDVVVHREGTGWVAHVVISFNTDATTNGVIYYSVTIDSAGAFTVGPQVVAGSSYGNAVHKYPSIDFHHTGDGKTVKDGTPHLFVGWSAGAAGAGKGIRFRKATYSAGAWTWGTEREIDSTRYVFSYAYWANCLFDGSRVIISGMLYGNAGALDHMIYERDVDDTVTTTHFLFTNSPTSDYYAVGSTTYDKDGNVYLLGRDGAMPADGEKLLRLIKWNRSTEILDSPVIVDSSARNDVHASFKRGHSNDKIEFIYTDGTASPYSVTYDSIDLNTLPTKPTLVTVQSPAVAGQGADASWQHNDPDGDPQSKWKYRLRKV